MVKGEDYHHAEIAYPVMAEFGGRVAEGEA